MDLGILFQHDPDLDLLCDVLLDFQHALGREDIDLIPLNRAGVLLRFEVVSGRPLFRRDVEFVSGFVSLTAREYEDETAFLQRALQSMPS